jgi:DNA polymerase alpha subunit B
MQLAMWGDLKRGDKLTSSRLDGLTPGSANGRPLNGGSVKRKSNFSSPAAPKFGRVESNGSPMGAKTTSSTINGAINGTQYAISFWN